MSLHDTEKDTLAWGERQALSLWENLYSRWDPSIDRRTVLDLGCSWGYFLRFLGEHFRPARLIGTDIRPWWDIRPHGWDYAALSSLEFHVGALPAIEALEAETVDLVLSTSVLQYLQPEELEETVECAYALLRPGGEFLLRTRVFTSYIGADLHSFCDVPYVHLLAGEPTIAAYVRDVFDREPPRVNSLTASAYLVVFQRAGFELRDVRRVPNRRAPDVLAAVRERFPWISEDELVCAELEARLCKPFEPERLGELARVVDTRPESARSPAG
jgi:SAM-dependent methyltransferase